MFMAVVLAGDVAAAGAVEACGDAVSEAEETGDSLVQAVTTSSRAVAGTPRARARRGAGLTPRPVADRAGPRRSGGSRPAWRGGRTGARPARRGCCARRRAGSLRG